MTVKALFGGVPTSSTHSMRVQNMFVWFSRVSKVIVNCLADTSAEATLIRVSLSTLVSSIESTSFADVS